MQTYDFIVVGSGSAGSVVAERLSASGRYSVLVLEAGGSDLRFYVQMPLGYGKTFFDPAVNWNYKTEPDPGLAGNADHWPRGKLLGGSSSINAMVWIRGHPDDYDAWRDAGNPGWGFADLLPAFKAIEDNEAGADAWRGARRTAACHRHARTRPPADQALSQGRRSRPACRSTRISTAPRQEGVGIYQITTKGGRRMSAARAFLRPAMKRPERPRRDERAGDENPVRGQRARSASNMSSNGKTAVARAGREVIVCRRLDQLAAAAAAFRRRPGRAARRASASRSSTTTRNVGANLQDHVGINYTFKGQRADAQPDPAALVGQAAGRHAISADCAAARCRCR